MVPDPPPTVCFYIGVCQVPKKQGKKKEKKKKKEKENKRGKEKEKRRESEREKLRKGKKYFFPIVVKNHQLPLVFMIHSKIKIKNEKLRGCLIDHQESNISNKQKRRNFKVQLLY